MKNVRAQRTTRFALWKVKLDNLIKFVYITWFVIPVINKSSSFAYIISRNPNGVPPIQKGLMGGRARDVGRFLDPFHLQHDAQSDADLDESVSS